MELWEGQNAVGLEFHKPLWINEADNLNEGACWPDRAEYLAVGTGSFTPATNIGEHDASADDMLKAAACLLDGTPDDVEADARLGVEVAGVGCARLGADRGCAGDSEIRADPDGPAETDLRL